MSKSFIIAGILVELRAALDFNQSYSEIGGESSLRMADGALKTQKHWTKLATTLTGVGWIPHGLAGLDWSQHVELSCNAPRSIADTGVVIDIPAARRSDAGYEPYGLAIVNDVEQVTPVVMAGDEMTLTAVAGATQYQAVWFPKIMVKASWQDNFNESGAEFSWSITAEEV